MAASVPALVVLRDQIDAAFPGRSKASDGWIGDAAHAARKSYHNPQPDGWVYARDFTHDPKAGFDIDKFTDELVASNDHRIMELIANGLYWHWENRKWVKYNGSNPHTHHFHITARLGPPALERDFWNLPSLKGAKPGIIELPSPKTVMLKRGMEGAEIRRLQEWLNKNYPAYSKLPTTGFFGEQTERVIKEFQRRSRITVDGIVGPQTRKALKFT